MRHGEAEHVATSDRLRPLTPRGEREVIRNASNLLEPAPELVIASPYLRAKQTAQTLIEALGQEIPLEISDSLTPDGDPWEVVRLLELHNDKNSLLVVSHMPMVGVLTGCLVDGSERSGIYFSTAMVVSLELAVYGAGMADVRWARGGG